MPGLSLSSSNQLMWPVTIEKMVNHSEFENDLLRTVPTTCNTEVFLQGL